MHMCSTYQACFVWFYLKTCSLLSSSRLTQVKQCHAFSYYTRVWGCNLFSHNGQMWYFHLCHNKHFKELTRGIFANISCSFPAFTAEYLFKVKCFIPNLWKCHRGYLLYFSFCFVNLSESIHFRKLWHKVNHWIFNIIGCRCPLV